MRPDDEQEEKDFMAEALGMIEVPQLPGDGRSCRRDGEGGQG
jgi:hypothetical protein